MQAASLLKWLLLWSVVFVSYGKGTRLCGSRLNRVLNDVCSFQNQTTPCFKGAFFEPHSFGNKGQIKSISTVQGIATECCIYGCFYSYIRNYCCFTLECLRHCYPDTAYTEKDANQWNRK